jgi:hypothetical protein
MIIKIFEKLKLLRNSSHIRSFITHNKNQFFDEAVLRSEVNSVVLFELNNFKSAHIAYSYLSNALASKYNARIIAYYPHRIARKWRRLFLKTKDYLNLQEFGVFRSFYTEKILIIEISNSQKERAHAIFSTVIEKISNKWDIERVVINDVWLGDLIYDTYLRQYNKPTIDKKSIEFNTFLKEFIETFVYWEDYFNLNVVRAVNVSHCVYDLAIPLRIAIKRGIPAYQANVTHLYQMSRDNYFAYGDFRYFPKLFSELPDDLKKAGISEAKRRIELRFGGVVGVDMPYSKKSAYGANRHSRLLKETDKKKILIAAHCFFDSPHSYGNNIFPDFYEWLEFLGKISELSDYDWYIKTHPDYLPGTKEIIDNFVLRYPKLNLLPADASHNQLIAEGIDFALTVYGTIGFEYASLGIPVINCSLNNPHISYNFNIHPKTVDEYRYLLLNLDALSFKINEESVYEYYFMKNICNTENIFFQDYNSMIKAIGGYSMQFTDIVYEKWINEWTPRRHKAILAAIDTFINSHDFRMDYKHFGRELTIQSFELNL